jgi:hypothetical protein
MPSPDDRRLRAIESKLRQYQVNISGLFGAIKELERRVARLESKGDSPATKKGQRHLGPKMWRDPESNPERCSLAKETAE